MLVDLKLRELGLRVHYCVVGSNLVRPVMGRVKWAFILGGLDLGFRPTIMVYNLFLIRVICLCSVWDLLVR